MNPLRPAKKEVRFGLDIGTRLIKVIELCVEANVNRLTKLRSAEIELPLTEEKAFASLRALMEDFKPSTKEVRISLSAPSAIVRFINMPKMKEEDLKSSLRFEAEKYIPFNIKEVVIDASILDYPGEEKKEMRILFAAAKRDVVDSRLAMLKELGLSASIIDVDSFACFNAFCNFCGTFDESISTVLLNIGYTQTNLIILRGSQPFFTRDIQIGVRDVAKVISEKMATPKEKADDFIYKLGDNSAEVYEIAKPILDNLVDELRLSFGYYENQYGTSINEIYVSGGMARLNNIMGHFEGNFDVKTTTWNPFAKFEISSDIDAKYLEAMQPQFAVSAGLVIRK